MLYNISAGYCQLVFLCYVPEARIETMGRNTMNKHNFIFRNAVLANMNEFSRGS